MEKQVISQKIIEDAHQKAQTIIQKAQSDADNLVVQANALANKLLEEVKEQTQKEGQILIERRKTLARLDAKKVILDCKQSLIAHSFEVAKNKLASISKEQYLDFVKKQVSASGEKGDKLVLCGSAPLTVEEVALLDEVKNLSITVERGENFGGGIKLLGAKCDKDLSFPAIVAEYAKRNVQEVSARIFR